ncbi:2-hydroxyacid dehydrogenase [Spirosoma pulveris]
MNIAFFSTLSFEQGWVDPYSAHHRITYISERLTTQTAHLAQGHKAVCVFVNDDLSRPVLTLLKEMGVAIVGMRCMGTDNVDTRAIAELGMTLLHTSYSPHSIAEHTVALLMGIVRHLPTAHQRVQMGNFAIDGLMGYDLHGKTVGVVGTGHIGKAFIRIMLGFGCKVLANDLYLDRRLTEMGVSYLSLPELLQRADVVSLHCPLNFATQHLINAQTLSLMKQSAILVNTGRGGLADTNAVLDALDTGKLAGYAADVYERERDYFHYDFSNKSIIDHVLNRLRKHPKVLLTAHQGFLTEDALRQIALGLINQFSFFDNQQTASITKASMC